MNYRKDIEEKGYVILPKLITDKACDYFKSMLEDAYKTYEPYYAKNTDRKSVV